MFSFQLKLRFYHFLEKLNFSQVLHLGCIGTFQWLVLSFGLKNEGATSQRAMNVIFHDMLGHHMEVYIDDIRVKSKRVIEHADHLRKSFKRMRHHQLKLNPLKCAFGVHARNFLGFLVHQKWIITKQKLLLKPMLHKTRKNSKSSGSGKLFKNIYL